MPTYAGTNSQFYDAGGNDQSIDFGAATFTDGNDDIWTVGEQVSDDNSVFVGTATYIGYVVVNGTSYPVFDDVGSYFIIFDDATDAAARPADLSGLIVDTFTACFGAGTLIATPAGETAVEALAIGDLIETADGRSVAVKWIGHQTLSRHFSGADMQPVRIAAGALGNGLPRADLVVTADHGMVIDGYVINASALVNGSTIDFVPLADLPATVTYYHVETADHDVILANGAPAETFVDAISRSHFNNHAEYLALYGAERIIPEMRAPRITAQRLLPQAIKARLGIAAAVPAVVARRSA